MWREVEISAQHEYRFEVGWDEPFVVKLESGQAELFGAEMVTQKEYEWKGVKLAIFTWTGAKLTVKGQPEVEYCSGETSIPAYFNCHLALEAVRQDTGQPIPRVLVVGEGRRTVARTLLNYAARQGRTPIWTSLDPQSTEYPLVPGTLNALRLEYPLGPMVEIGGPLTSTGSISLLSVWYGHSNASDNVKLYRKQTRLLAGWVDKRIHVLAEGESDRSGLIAVPPADCDAAMLSHLCDALSISVVLVIGDERLLATLTRQLNGPTLLRLPANMGVVKDINSAWKRQQLQACWQRYFYGAHREYCPYPLTLSFASVQIRRLGEDDLAPASALPLGATRRVDETRLAKVEPSSSNLLYSIIGIPANPTDERDLESCSLYGYGHVTAVEETRKTFTMLVTCPVKLPDNPFLLIGSIKWMEV